MNKKKIVLGGIIVIIVVGALSGILFYHKNLRGARPAILPPSGDIANTLPPSGPGSESINTTGIPLALPSGFGISLYAKGLKAPRALAFDPVGRLVASIPSQGKVIAFDDVQGAAGSPITVIDNLSSPHGLAFRCDTGGACKLFVAETSSVKVYTYDIRTAKASNATKILDLPSGGNHTSRTITIIHTNSAPRLLVSSGSSCNVCIEKDERRAAVWSANLDGSDFRAYATGLRNSVFFATNPSSGELWATEMGRDLLGDNTPPDEVNIITEGRDYGWPICYGKNTHDTDFDRNTYIRNPCQDKTASHIDLQAHSAPLGLAFIPNSSSWPEEYKHNLLVAYHGSWNRTTPTGYKIVRFELNSDGTVKNTTDFLTGFLAADGKSALGRPVDILAKDDGTLYISDDKAGVIYKLTHLN